MESNGDLRAAFGRLLRGEVPVRVLLQPIADLRTGRAAGYEALARFPEPFHPSPDVVLAQAEVLGLAAEVEALLLACSLERRRHLPPNTFLTVNVSPHLLAAPEIAAVLGATDLRGVFVELTEHTAAADLAAVRGHLDDLRRRGALVAVDDAGSGYSGLTRLLALRPDLVKLDKELLGSLTTDPARVTVVRVLGDLTNQLDAWVLAEGVEDPDALDVLLDLGVPLAQGWLLGRPAAAPRPVPADVADRVRARPGLRSMLHHVASLAVRTPPLTLEEVHAGAGRVGLSGRVVVDEHHHPRGITCARGDEVAVQDVLVAPLSTSPAALGRRAATRAPSRRADPVAVVDADGRYAGVVTVPSLLLRLAEMADPELAADAPGLLRPFPGSAQEREVRLPEVLGRPAALRRRAS